MSKLSPMKKIEILSQIKYGILSSLAVTDTVWMPYKQQTVIEAIDELLLDLGLTVEDIEDVQADLTRNENDK
jgi:hypothetical protein